MREVPLFRSLKVNVFTSSLTDTSVAIIMWPRPDRENNGPPALKISGCPLVLKLQIKTRTSFGTSLPCVSFDTDIKPGALSIRYHSVACAWRLRAFSPVRSVLEETYLPQRKHP